MAFRFEVICEDKVLASVLRRLAGPGVQMSPPIPMVEAPAAGAVNGALNAAGNAVWQGILADKLTEIRPKQAGAFLTTAGLSAQTATYAMNNLIKNGLVKRTSKPGIYKVLGGSK